MILVLAVGVVMGIFFSHSHREAAPSVESSVATNQHASNMPRIAIMAKSVAPAPEAPTNRNCAMRYLETQDWPKLTMAQVEPYVDANHRSAGSLLAAFRTTSEPRYLREAMQKFPNDPRVNYAAAFSPDLSPEEQLQALANFKQSDPNNALPDYLLAAKDFKSGQQTEALQEMAEASKKSSWQDYTADFIQNAKEAYLSAGYSDTESKYIAAATALLPDLGQIKSVGVNLTDLAKSYQQSGDTVSAQSALQSAVNLGQQFNGATDQPLITTLVGIAIEKMAFNAMDPSTPYGDSGQTVRDQLSALTQQRESIRQLVNQEQGLVSQMNDQDLSNFLDRRRMFGYVPAMQWAQNRFGSQ